ncbi:MAG: hypothetical protein D6726_06955 [Nitrospirae bacterium]|nr:MAG: hypothetical protein D6726_06955 [Nitrospirota bacterium]
MVKQNLIFLAIVGLLVLACFVFGFAGWMSSRDRQFGIVCYDSDDKVAYKAFTYWVSGKDSDLMVFKNTKGDKVYLNIRAYKRCVVTEEDT